ncbi:Hypothetical protein FKW44_003100 [Caligus rogercresseyi]|uniref:Uncharacterized protein n=1 Tax=Caligus rogercresseyi TaxID=217165 RepID=A0A7T8KLH2_CALRO|nr:Hypothetical protein FKW44_003100 [Caligus rogercresseyi]
MRLAYPPPSPPRLGHSGLRTQSQGGFWGYKSTAKGPHVRPNQSGFWDYKSPQWALMFCRTQSGFGMLKSPAMGRLGLPKPIRVFWGQNPQPMGPHVLPNTIGGFWC